MFGKHMYIFILITVVLLCIVFVYLQSLEDNDDSSDDEITDDSSDSDDGHDIFDASLKLDEIVSKIMETKHMTNDEALKEIEQNMHKYCPSGVSKKVVKSKKITSASGRIQATNKLLAEALDGHYQPGEMRERYARKFKCKEAKIAKHSRDQQWSEGTTSLVVQQVRESWLRHVESQNKNKLPKVRKAAIKRATQEVQAFQKVFYQDVAYLRGDAKLMKRVLDTYERKLDPSEKRTFCDIYNYEKTHALVRLQNQSDTGSTDTKKLSKGGLCLNWQRGRCVDTNCEGIHGECLWGDGNHAAHDCFDNNCYMLKSYIPRNTNPSNGLPIKTNVFKLIQQIADLKRRLYNGRVRSRGGYGFNRPWSPYQQPAANYSYGPNRGQQGQTYQPSPTHQQHGKMK